MPHVRQRIRERVAALLGDLPTTRSNVHMSRPRQPDAEATPCLFIWTRNEASEVRAGAAPRYQVRELELVVDLASFEAMAADVVDECCAEVEAALAADPRLGGLVKNSALRLTITEFSDDEHYPGAMARLEYRVTYVTTDTDPTTAQ